MRILLLISFIAFSLVSLSQNKEMLILSNGDTINLLNKNGKRQGYWKLMRGMVYQAGYYDNNIREGIWITYGVNEKPELISSYKKGKLHGATLLYDENGVLRKAH